MAKVIMVCPVCGSDDVTKDALATWDVETQNWILSNPFDNENCNECGEDGKGMLERKEI